MRCKWAFPKHKVVFYMNPKCATTFFDQCIDLLKEKGNKVPADRINKQELINDYTHIFFIRNPYIRLVSTFIDRCRDQEGFDYEKQLFSTFCTKNFYKNNIKITFENCVDLVVKKRFDIIDDWHFCQQIKDEDINCYGSYKNKIFYDIDNTDLNVIFKIFNKNPIRPPEKNSYGGKYSLNTKTYQFKLKNDNIDYKVYDKDLKDYYGNKFNDKKYFYNEKLKLDVYNCYENDFKFFRDNNIFFDINTID